MGTGLLVMPIVPPHPAVRSWLWQDEAGSLELLALYLGQFVPVYPLRIVVVDIGGAVSRVCRCPPASAGTVPVIPKTVGTAVSVDPGTIVVGVVGRALAWGPVWTIGRFARARLAVHDTTSSASVAIGCVWILVVSAMFPIKCMVFEGVVGRSCPVMLRSLHGNSEVRMSAAAKSSRDATRAGCLATPQERKA